MSAQAIEQKKAKAAHVWSRDPHEWYVEPHRVTEQLLRVEPFEGTIYDPACGTGNVVEACRRAGYEAHGGDLVNRYGESLQDAPAWFCAKQDFFQRTRLRFDNIVTNPPYAQAEAFIRHALALRPRKLATFVNLRFLTSDDRASGIYAECPPARVWIITPRPSCPPGEFLRAGGKAEGGSIDFCWLVWDRDAAGGETRLGWLRAEARP